MRRRSDRAVVFMAKWPEPGRAKTRLSPQVTPVQAAELARCFLLDTLDEARGAGVDRWLAFAPASRRADFRRLVGPGVGLIAAETPSFGLALEQAQRGAFRLGYHRVALVASDLPHLPADRYDQAFEGLATADVILGPCADGGYYLLAAGRPTPHLFHGVAWSTAVVYERTCLRATQAGIHAGTIAACDDVDTAADLALLFAQLCRRPGAGRTLHCLSNLYPKLEGWRLAGPPNEPLTTPMRVSGPL